MVNWRLWLRSPIWTIKTWWAARKNQNQGPEVYVRQGMSNDKLMAGVGQQSDIKITQTAVGSEQVLAPLDTAKEWKEPIFGPACIVNESSRRLTLRNDLLFIIIGPGERHIISQEIMKRGYDWQARSNTVETWDPLMTLQDLIAEYERSQDPVTRYNWSKEALLECSQLKAFRVRGGTTEETKGEA